MKGKQTIHVLRITLVGCRPPIWRTVAVPSDFTLGQLHDVIQIAMGWTDCHLHQFVLRDKSLKPSQTEVQRAMLRNDFDEKFSARLRGERIFEPATTPFGDPIDTVGEDENEATVDSICRPGKGKLTYTYDFGDDWDHTVEVKSVEEPRAGRAYPVCLAGKRACPPEDCGGIYRYQYMLAALADPDHEEHADAVEWLGDGFDPAAFDREEVNAQFTEWRTADSEPTLWDDEDDEDDI